MRQNNLILPILKSYFLNSKKKNPSFSMRSLARILEISPSLLSQIFSEKKKPSHRVMMAVYNKLPLTDEEKQSLLGVGARPIASKASGQYQSPEFKELYGEFDLSWLESAILDLLTLPRLSMDVHSISEKIGCTDQEALDAFEALEKKSLLKIEDGKIRKTYEKVYFNVSKSNESVRNYHKESLRRAYFELSRTADEAVKMRQFNGMTLTVDMESFEEARRRLKNFIQEITDLLSTPKATELYQFNVHLFPVRGEIYESEQILN